MSEEKTAYGRAPVYGDLDRRFDYHPPVGGKQQKHEAVRRHCKGLAYIFEDMLPVSREKSLALTKLEEALMWANAAIARNEEVEYAENNPDRS